MNVCIETSDSLIYPLHFRHYLAPNERFISLMLAELFLLAKLPEINAAPRPSDYVRLPGIGQKRYGSLQMDRAKKHIMKNTSVGHWLKDKRWGKISEMGNYERFDNGWLFGLSLGFSSRELAAEFAARCQRLALASSARPFHHFSWL